MDEEHRRLLPTIRDASSDVKVEPKDNVQLRAQVHTQGVRACLHACMHVCSLRTTCSCARRCTRIRRACMYVCMHAHAVQLRAQVYTQGGWDMLHVHAGAHAGWPGMQAGRHPCMRAAQMHTQGGQGMRACRVVRACRRVHAGAHAG